MSLACEGFTFHIVSPSIQGAMFQIVKVALIGIGLTLKRDVAVGIASHGQPHQPFKEIGKVEEHKKHLALLCSVDAFMVHQFIAQIHSGVHKKHPQQINRCESFERQY